MKGILTISLLLVCSLLGFAQKTGEDAELDALVANVCSLRGHQSRDAVYDKVKDAFVNDELWTQMLELGRIPLDGECRPLPDDVSFRLNRLLVNVENDLRPKAYQSTHGDFKNGEDPKYSYSLMERYIAAGDTVTYQLNKNVTPQQVEYNRHGSQEFVVLPFDPDTVGELEATLIIREEKIAFTKDNERGLLTAKGVAVRDETFMIEVVNNGNKPQSIVIINHNTRR